jgi:O-antigen/teichoic acid export membrane protein
VLQVVFVAVGAKWFGRPGAVAGYIAFLALPALGALMLIAPRGIRQRTRPVLEPGLRRRVARYAFDTWLPGLVAAIVWTRAELFFLDRYFSEEVVGYFAVALGMAALATQLPLLLSGALLPHMAQRLGEGKVEAVQALYASATRILAFVAFPLAAVIAGSAPVLVPLMYGEKFIPAVGSVAVLVSVAAVAAAGSAGSALVYAAERSSFMLLVGIVGSVAVIACGVTVIPHFGAAGAAWSRAVIQVSSVAWGMWFIATKLRYNPPVASLLKTAIASAASGAAAFAVTWQWHYASWSLPLAVIAAMMSFLALTWLLKPLDSADTHALWQVVSRFVRPLRRGVEGIS